MNDSLDIIKYNNSNNIELFNQNNLSFSINTENNLNRMLAVSISIKSDNIIKMNVLNITYGSKSLKLVNNASIFIEDNNSYTKSIVYYLENPDIGQNKFNLELSGICDYILISTLSLSNVSQCSPLFSVTNIYNDEKKNKIKSFFPTDIKNKYIFSTIVSSEICQITRIPDNTIILDNNTHNNYSSTYLTSDYLESSLEFSFSSKVYSSIISVFFIPIIRRYFSISFDSTSPLLNFASNKLESILQKNGYQLVKHPLDYNSNNINLRIRVKNNSNLKREGYEILDNKKFNIIESNSYAGAMYGLLDFSEKIKSYDFKIIPSCKVYPTIDFRAIKHNTPWSSYRIDYSINQHTETMKDTFYWESFLNMMAENRFNKLTLWTTHPFPYMIRSKNFPKATPFSQEELEQWKFLYKSIFKMAKDRNIETYIVNWNIFVSDEFRINYDNKATSDTMGHIYHEKYNSSIIEKYTKESVTQLLEEYPNLTGFGFTLGENMGGMDSIERNDWIQRTIIKGMQNANRKTKLIYRLPLSANKHSGGSTNISTEIMTRNSLDSIENISLPIETEIKFNWSHSYSNVELIHVHGGKVTDTYYNPIPKNYRINWMIRNEDFFILRWCDTNFIRKHIKLNNHDYVGGYFIGSECYYPALNYIDKENNKYNKNRFGFNRQWLYYMSWGRILYNIDTPDYVFINKFNNLYSTEYGNLLLAALKKASEFTSLFGSFIFSTWDFTTYAEGFLCPVNLFDEKSKSPFITINDLINYKPLAKNLLSIKDYVNSLKSKVFFDNKITPKDLISSLSKNTNDISSYLSNIQTDNSSLQNEIADINIWLYLTKYFYLKLESAISLYKYLVYGNIVDKDHSIIYIKKAIKEWENIISISKIYYNEVPLIHIRDTFSWKKYLKEVKSDLKIIKDSFYNK